MERFLYLHKRKSGGSNFFLLSRPVKQSCPHLNLLAFLHGNVLVVFVIPLDTFCTHRHLVSLAEHRQRLVVLPAEVTAGKGGRICQSVSLQRRIPLVRCEVKLTVRRLAHEARLNGRQPVSVADITGNLLSLEKLVWDVFLASWLRHDISILLLIWCGQLRTFDLN